MSSEGAGMSSEGAGTSAKGAGASSEGAGPGSSGIPIPKHLRKLAVQKTGKSVPKGGSHRTGCVHVCAMVARVKRVLYRVCYISAIRESYFT